MNVRDVNVVDSVSTEKYLRVASISVALYDYLITLPAEWRFYRSQSHVFRLSLACILFILIRYSSILVMVVSNYGVFTTTFTAESCAHYYLIAPIFKVVQVMVSQVILGVRAFNITRRNRRVGIGLLIFYFITVGFEWFINLYDRIPSVDNGNCTPGNSPHQTAWLFYLFAMLYDSVTLVISTVYLLRYNTTKGRFSRLIRAMLYDGLGYFVVLTAVNIFNLILYQASDDAVQSSGASLGYGVTWIMSQRILIHLREMCADMKGRLDNVVVSRQLCPGRDVATALRSQFGAHKGPIDVEFAPGSAVASENDVELDIQVHVERSVTVEYSAEELGQGQSLRKPPRVKWNSSTRPK
ncbi:hypothetical protein F5I97DRAFT_363864 [Phlebopus sp. FC_14]|nr:hypothetical protein F5I97DRAFT_363864 [Phlebopus sp. FC_14]